MQYILAQATPSPLWVTVIQTAGPPLIAVFAVVAAFIAVSGIQAQLATLREIARDAAARHSRSDGAVRLQVVAMLDNIASELLFFLDFPQAIGLQDQLSSYSDRLAAHIYDVSRAGAFSTDELAVLLRYVEPLQRDAKSLAQYQNDVEGATTDEARAPIALRIRWTALQGLKRLLVSAAMFNRQSVVDAIKEALGRYDEGALLDQMVQNGFISPSFAEIARRKIVSDGAPPAAQSP